MKRLISFCLALLIFTGTVFALVSCGNSSDALPNTVVIEIENFGSVTVELYPRVAPITVDNFKKLVSQGFYDGLTFHRVVPGFVIQGGDPNGDGTGGSETSIKGEFSANGVKNTLSHTRGVLSMARGSSYYESLIRYYGYSASSLTDDQLASLQGGYDSASSQFFIVLDDSATASLDGYYAAFGEVIQGMDVVDAIAAVTTDESDKPVTDVVITRISFVYGD